MVVEAWRSTGCLSRDANFANSAVQQAHTVYPIKTDIILLQVGSLACSTAQSLGKSSAAHVGRFHTCAWHHGSWVPNQHHYKPSHSSRPLPFVRLNCCINTIALFLCCLSGAHLGLTAVFRSCVEQHQRGRRCCGYTVVADKRPLDRTSRISFIKHWQAHAATYLGDALGPRQKLPYHPYCYS